MWCLVELPSSAGDPCPDVRYQFKRLAVEEQEEQWTNSATKVRILSSSLIWIPNRKTCDSRGSTCSARIAKVQVLLSTEGGGNTVSLLGFSSKCSMDLPRA